MLFCPCVVRKYTAHLSKKALNIRHQEQKGFRDIFFGIPQPQKGYLVNVSSTRKIIYSYDVVFDEITSSTLAYKSQSYSEVIYICSSVSCTPCAKSLREQTGDIIMFAQFEEGDLVSETRDNTESSDESDNNSIMPPQISKEEIDAMDSGDESDDKPMSTKMLENIHDGSKSHPSVNRREAHYKIRDRIKQSKTRRK